MLPQSQPVERLFFGPFEVNVPAGQLLKSGTRIRVSGQPFQILLILLAHPGDVIANEQLREQIWQEGTFVDFEHGLHAAVNKLRPGAGRFRRASAVHRNHTRPWIPIHRNRRGSRADCSVTRRPPSTGHGGNRFGGPPQGELALAARACGDASARCDWRLAGVAIPASAH
jgi:Transcriptional regulatory protein, C terminal